MRRIAVLLALILGFPSALAQPALAQNAAGVPVQGAVRDQRGGPVSGASLVLIGGRTPERTSTDARGHFTFESVVPGAYTLHVSKAGFISSSYEFSFAAGALLPIDVTLAQESLSTIATVSANASQSINTGTASVSTISSDVFSEQGLTGVAKALNETPGIVATFGGSNVNGEANGAMPSTYFTPQIRGALPYETASLIDGHGITLGYLGAFDAAFIDPNVLQDVEVVKGPGAWAPNLNYAITGTVNFRTLEPTLARRVSFEQGVDSWGGLSSNIRATGTTGRLGYAFDYATDGDPGPLNGYQALVGVLPYNAGLPQSAAFNGAINGLPICAGAGPTCGTSYYTLGPKPNVNSNLVTNTPLVGCCLTVNGTYSRRNELGKIRYNFSQQTALTVSYLGVQANYSETGSILYSQQAFNFAPPAGYTGSIPAGPLTGYGDCCAAQFTPYTNNVADNIYQADFRTTAKNTTFLARYYYSFDQNGQPTPGDSFPGALRWNLTLNGGIPLNGSTTPTIFDGQNATFTFPYDFSTVNLLDKSYGTTLEIDQQAGSDLFTVSYDSTTSSSDDTSTFFNFNTTAPGTETYAFIPNGSSQTFSTLSARAMLQLGSNLEANLSDSNMIYTSHFTPDGGTAFEYSTHSFNAPRAGLTWRPRSNLAVRLSAGSSIAPPYLKLISSPSYPPTPNNYTAPTFFTEDLNSGNILPETAFSYDLGSDARIGSPEAKRSGHALIVSADAYLTNVRDQYLPVYQFISSSYSNPTYPGLTLPLYAATTENIAHSRYDGLELTARTAPPFGLGYIAQGSLIRAYAYDVPAGFYNTPLGPDTTNLAVLPGVNFQGSAYTGLVNGDWNGEGNGRVPYAMGYGELNYHWRNGIYALLGATYYGNNNSFNVPAFFEFNAGIRLPVARNAYLQISGENLTDQDGAYMPCIDCGIPVPLVNHQIGLTESVNLGPPSFQSVLHWDL